MRMRKRYPIVVLLVLVAAIALGAALVTADAGATDVAMLQLPRWCVPRRDTRRPAIHPPACDCVCHLPHQRPW